MLAKVKVPSGFRQNPDVAQQAPSGQAGTYFTGFFAGSSPFGEVRAWLAYGYVISWGREPEG